MTSNPNLLRGRKTRQTRRCNGQVDAGSHKDIHVCDGVWYDVLTNVQAVQEQARQGPVRQEARKDVARGLQERAIDLDDTRSVESIIVHAIANGAAA
jgi:hypothetical protein